MSKNYIFISAPADVVHALKISEEKKAFSETVFVVVNVKEIYRYLKTIITSKVIFIPYKKDFSFKNIHNIIKEKIRLKKIYHKNFLYLKDCDIYFFTQVFDWITFSFIKKLKKLNTIYLLDHYSVDDSDFRQQKGVVNKLKSVLFSMYLNTPIELVEFYEDTVMRLQYKKLSIARGNVPAINSDIYTKFALPINNVISPSILLFESNLSFYNYIDGYKKKITKLVKDLSNKGYNIYLKPHPRLGYTCELDKFITKILPREIPGEFLPLEKFDIIIGVLSVALAKRVDIFKTKNIYSLIDCFKFKNEKKKESFKRYLNQQSNNSIVYIEKIDDLKIEKVLPTKC